MNTFPQYNLHKPQSNHKEMAVVRLKGHINFQNVQILYGLLPVFKCCTLSCVKNLKYLKVTSFL